MSLLVVSPHLDDAVLSAGQVIAGWPGPTVLTLCTGVPEHQPERLTTFDANCGFASALDAMAHRRMEDQGAMAGVGASAHHAGLLDQQYRDGADYDVDMGVAALLGVLALTGAEVLLGPLGLVHPDHDGAAEVVRQVLCHHRTDLQAWVYEDHPSSVLHPESVPLKLEWWRLMGFTPVLDFLGTGPIDAKEHAVRKYRSQLWALDMHAVLVPERMHRLVRT